MGGDLGPLAIVEGAIQAARDLNISSIIVGNQNEIKPHLESLGAGGDLRIKIKHASETVTMEDSPSLALRGKTDSSIRVAYELVKNREASAVVSPGNTGAVMATGLLVSGTLPGIARPAIAALIPRIGTSTPVVMMDSGANTDCHAYQLVQFALMGSHYAMSALHCENPRVALLSNGTEVSKGNDILRAAAMTLSEQKGVNFTGYIEGRDLTRDVADVVVCDGFIGNVALKTLEGGVEFVLDLIKHHVEGDLRGKVGMWLAKPMLKSLFLEKLDPSSYGGAPLLGLNDIAIICHGSSNARAIMNAMRVAQKFAEESLISRIAAALGTLDSKMAGSYEDGMWGRVGQRFEKRKKEGPAAQQHDPSQDLKEIKE